MCKMRTYGFYTPSTPQMGCLGCKVISHPKMGCIFNSLVSCFYLFWLTFELLLNESLFQRIQTDSKRIQNGLERIYKKHDILDCSFEILEWWWSRWCVDCYSLRVNVGTWWLLWGMWNRWLVVLWKFFSTPPHCYKYS